MQRKFWTILGILGALMSLSHANFMKRPELLASKDKETSALSSTNESKKYLSDIVLGDPQAPHKVIMYFAPDCAHCQEYMQTVLPEIDKKFIETKRVAFVLKDFPISGAGLVASQLAWARGPEHYLTTLKALMKDQEKWNIDECQFSVQKKNPQAKTKCAAAFLSVVEHVGFNASDYDKTVRNEKLQDEILEHRITIHRKEKIVEVPTFVIDGKKIEDILTPELLEKMIG